VRGDEPTEPERERMADARPILLFDGVCNVCNATVQFVLAHEKSPELRFASLQSAVGAQLVAERGLPGDISTVVLVEGDRVSLRSSAAVRLMRRLKAPWSWLALLWLVPRPLRDLGYDLFARVRYRLFGKRDSCMVPTPELRERFLG
jgi:predicted DCC family thiol-disulfide oxidoreductase YuxK